jgi:hypothetical protein
MLGLEHLSKRFGEKLAVDDVTFTVSAGEIFALNNIIAFLFVGGLLSFAACVKKHRSYPLHHHKDQ